jgi:hypothetical protein
LFKSVESSLKVPENRPAYVATSGVFSRLSEKLEEPIRDRVYECTIQERNNVSSDDESITEEPVTETQPRRRRRRRARPRRKSFASLMTFILWSAFIVLFLLFYAGNYPFDGIFEIIGVGIASFILVIMVNAFMWTPSNVGPGEGGWRVYSSIFGALGWMMFIVIWLPFFMVDYGLSQNLAVYFASFFAFLLFVAAPWVSLELGGQAKRARGGFLVFLLWFIFPSYWLWFEADAYYWEYTAAIFILSILVLTIIEVGLMKPLASESGDEVKGIGLLIIWEVLMFIWFFFFAQPFNVYQNVAVAIVTFMVFVAIAIFLSGEVWREIDDIDWDDEEEDEIEIDV